LSGGAEAGEDALSRDRVFRLEKKRIALRRFFAEPALSAAEAFAQNDEK